MVVVFLSVPLEEDEFVDDVAAVRVVIDAVVVAVVDMRVDVMVLVIGNVVVIAQAYATEDVMVAVDVVAPVIDFEDDVAHVDVVDPVVADETVVVHDCWQQLDLVGDGSADDVVVGDDIADHVVVDAIDVDVAVDIADAAMIVGAVVGAKKWGEGII